MSATVVLTQNKETDHTQVAEDIQIRTSLHGQEASSLGSQDAYQESNHDDQDHKRDSGVHSNRDSGSHSNRITHNIVFTSCSTGLGIKIIGGINEADEVDDEDEEDIRDFGVFIRRVLPGGLAAQEGRLQEGDQLLSVNGSSLEWVTNDEAVSLLRQASAQGYVNLTVARDQQAREEYMDLLQAYAYSSSSSVSGSNQNLSSRATSPGTPLSPSGSLGLPGGYCGNSMTTDKPQRLQSASLYPSTSFNGGIPGSQAASPQGMVQSPRPVNQRGLNLGQVMSGMSRGQLMMPHHSSTHFSQARPQTSAASSSHSNKIHKGLVSRLEHSPPDGASSLPPNSLGLAMGDGLDPSPVLPSAGAFGREFYPQGSSVGYQTPKQQMSLDPNIRLKIEKLEMALQYLGIEPNLDQQIELRQRLKVDSTGTVPYGDFVRVARDMFHVELEERQISSPRAPLHTAAQICDLTEPPPFKQQQLVSELPINSELEQVRAERDQLRSEVTRLKTSLRQRELRCTEAEDELYRIKREAEGVAESSRSLRSKVHLAEQAQRAARSMEQDYEEVVRLLEKEVAELRASQGAESRQDHSELQKRFAVLGCQLRKAEISKRTYEVATEKLLHFTEVVQDTLLRDSQGPHPLATEARKVANAVKSLLEVEPLPFGWDEAYTEDGMKYYVNHVTQLTSWQHPVTKVQHAAKAANLPHTSNHSNQSKRPKAGK